MVSKYLGGKIEDEYLAGNPLSLDKVDEWLADYRYDQALAEIWDAVAWANKFVNDEKPWVLAKENEERLKEVLGRLIVVLKEITNRLFPFMPTTAIKMRKLLQADRLSPPELPLFPRLDIE